MTVVAAGPRAWRPVLWKFLWVGLTSFGQGRWAYLHRAFVRSGWIREDLFLRDFAATQVLPGATFVNLIVLCGMRLHGIRMGLAGLALVALPGAVSIVAAMLYLSGTDPRLERVLHGVLIGAVAALFATFIRSAREGVRSRSDSVLATGTLLLMIVGVPLVVTIPVAAMAGIWWRRSGLPSVR